MQGELAAGVLGMMCETVSVDGGGKAGARSQQGLGVCERGSQPLILPPYPP